MTQDMIQGFSCLLILISTFCVPENIIIDLKDLDEATKESRGELQRRIDIIEIS